MRRDSGRPTAGVQRAIDANLRRDTRSPRYRANAANNVARSAAASAPSRPSASAASNSARKSRRRRAAAAYTVPGVLPSVVAISAAPKSKGRRVIRPPRLTASAFSRHFER